MQEQEVLVSGKAYRVKRKIGSGGYGDVYVFLDEKGGEFAAKVLTILPDPTRIASFKNEFLLLTQLKHPHICQAHDFTWSESLQKYLFISDLAPGESFFEATAQKSPEEIERLAVQVLEVLDYIHQHDVIHFDIKCPNILASPDGEIKLLDFGMAHLESLPLKKFPGSLRYAAPEILLRSQSTDHRADLYSFGIVLYRALTRHFPFNENDPAEMIDWHLHKTVAWTAPENQTIPAYLRSLVEFLLRKIPAGRLSRAQAAVNWINLHTENRYRGAFRGRHPAMPHEGRLTARDREVEQAGQALESPSGQSLIFTGERGIGKSRLLKEIKYMAEVKEFSCLWLDDFTRRDGLSQLTRQLDLPPFHSPDEFFQSSFDRMQEKKTLALFIDDLQEADPFFCEWLSRLHAKHLPICLFLGWEGFTPTGGPLVSLFRSAKILPLTPFSREDLQTFLGEVLAESSSKWLAPLYDFSSGIPLLVTEGVRYLMEGAKEARLPESIETLYENELVALSPDTSSVLETLSLWRSPPTLEELASGVPLEVSKLIPLTPHLISKGLLTRVSSFENPEVRYRLPNAALILVLKSRQGEEVKRDRLMRILTALEARKDAPAEERASVAYEAGNRSKARAYLFELAEHYEGSFQTGRAIETYRRGLEFSEGELELTSRIRKRLIPLLVLAGQPDEALALFPPKKKLPLADRKLMGWVLARSGRFQEAAELYREGIEESDERTPLHGELINQLANVHVQTGEIDKALVLFRQTLPPPEASDEEKFRLLKNNNLGLALALSGEIETAKMFEREKLAFLKKRGDEHEIAIALSQLGFIELRGQELTQAAATFEEALSLSEKIGDLHNILIVLDNLISIFQRRGLYHEALRYFSRAVDYRTAVSPPYQILQNYLKGAFLYLTMGLAEPARNCLEKMNALLVEAPSLSIIGWTSLAWGYYHRAAGSLAEAEDKIKKAIRLAEQKNEPGLIAWGYYALADLWMEQGRLDEVGDAFRQCSPHASKAGDDELKLRIRLLALLLQKEGKIPADTDPVEELEQLTSECEAKGLKEVAAETYAHLNDPRAKEIYLEIASHLPEEYKMAYLGERFRSQVLSH